MRGRVGWFRIRGVVDERSEVGGEMMTSVMGVGLMRGV